MVRSNMDRDQATGNMGGTSTLILLMPFQTAPTDGDRSYAIERREYHRSFLPGTNAININISY